MTAKTSKGNVDLMRREGIQKTLIVFAVAAVLAALTIFVAFLTEAAERLHDRVALMVSSVTLGLSLFMFVWWLALWVRQIIRQIRSRPKA